MNEREPIANEKRITRRDVIKGLGAILGTGAMIGAIEATNHIVDNEPNTTCEDVPPPTGHTLFDVYGNKTDSNELLSVGYAEAVRRQECRDNDNDK